MNIEKPQILLTNDDGIESPGLWAAAAALSELGYVHVVAPREQCSGTGRSLPSTSDGLIQLRQVEVNGKCWEVYAVGGTPAQAVLHGVLEILQTPPSLVVSGINYGENVGSGVTISGTVGAALEASALGFPALAMSLETAVHHHFTYSTEIDFSVAAFFTQYFGSILLEKQLPEEVKVLKVDVPASATPQTPWEITRLSKMKYYAPVAPQRLSWDIPAPVSYRAEGDPAQDQPGTDVYALRVNRTVSVTPLSLDLTSRVDMAELDRAAARSLGKFSLKPHDPAGSAPSEQGCY